MKSVLLQWDDKPCPHEFPHVLVDSEGYLKFFNSSFERLFKLDLRRDVNKHLDELRFSLFDEGYAQPVMSILKTKERFTGFLIRHHTSNIHCKHFVIIKSLYDESINVLGYSITGNAVASEECEQAANDELF